MRVNAMKLKWEHQISGNDTDFNIFSGYSFYPQFLCRGDNIYILHNAADTFRPEFRDKGIESNRYVMCNEFNPINGFVNHYLFTIPKEKEHTTAKYWNCHFSDNCIIIDTKPHEYLNSNGERLVDSLYYRKVLCLNLTNGDFNEYGECNPIIIPSKHNHPDFPRELYSNEKYHVYMKSAQSMICEDAATGDLLWQQKTKLFETGTRAQEVNGKLLFTTTKTNGLMYCVDLANGEILLMHDMRLNGGQYTYHNGIIYFGNGKGQITAVSDKTFTVTDTIKTTYPTAGLPINVIDNCLYTITQNPNGGAMAVVCCEI